MFNSSDIEFIKSKGINEEQILTQIQGFKDGFAFVHLSAAATFQNGLVRFSKDEISELTDFYDSKSPDRNILKFVPASGAASRMFKHLFEFRDQFDHKPLPELLKDKSFNSVHYFFDKLNDLAFFNDLKEVMESKGADLEDCIKEKDYNCIIGFLLDKDNLNYASLPKGLIKFHNYSDGSRWAIEEHLVEGSVYCKNSSNEVKIHFTVSPEHQNKFTQALDKAKSEYEKKYGVTFDISLSIQKPSTDILAVDLENNPLRDKQGKLIFRPGGHGALIENLNDIKGDIIFVKNIDNIVPDRLRGTTYTYKKLIAGYLIKLQDQTFKYLNILEKDWNGEKLKEIELFTRKELMISLPADFNSLEEKRQVLFNKLNRPMRICGMVKNEGEPGGGPFWVSVQDGLNSLQIVEASQIDKTKADQKEILSNATHFNPVDLVCGVRDYKGEKFNLKQFVDPKTGFISKKSQNGIVLKAQELPGLWNGAMADWITIFVDCPIITFNPVKIINDLLREQHQ